MLLRQGLQRVQDTLDARVDLHRCVAAAHVGAYPSGMQARHQDPVCLQVDAHRFCRRVECRLFRRESD